MTLRQVASRRRRVGGASTLARGVDYTRSNRPAAPMPPPMHMLTMP